jgi:AcrR family transcriptional regulator
MSEQSAPSKREQLLERIVDHVLQHGIADLTLRDLAAGVGSNNRMLLYYFDSRDELMHTALRAAVGRFPAMAGLLGLLDDDARPVAERLQTAWLAISAPENLPFHRLFFQVFGLAGFAPDRFEELLATVGSEWVTHVRAALVSDGWGDGEAGAAAHDVVALWRGLQLTLLSTGDHALVDAAAERGIAALLTRV